MTERSRPPARGTRVLATGLLAVVAAGLGGDAERRQLLCLVLACLVVFVYAGLW